MGHSKYWVPSEAFTEKCTATLIKHSIPQLDVSPIQNSDKTAVCSKIYWIQQVAESCDDRADY